MITSGDNDVEKLEPPYIAGEIVKRYSHFRKHIGIYENTEPAYELAIPLLGMYPRQRKTYGHTKTCT